MEWISLVLVLASPPDNGSCAYRRHQQARWKHEESCRNLVRDLKAVGEMRGCKIIMPVCVRKQ